MMERSPRAPVLRLMVLRAMAPSASCATVRSTLSLPKTLFRLTRGLRRNQNIIAA